MTTGVQFTGTLLPGQTERWFTFDWPQAWYVEWNVVPTSVKSGAPAIQWDVEVERASNDNITYWITITNLVSDPVDIEARFAILN